MRRAISDNQKQQRREMIMATARELYQRTGFEAITMSMVAEQTQLAKGTLYLYFTTKEELFLALTIEELTGWFSELNHGLRQGITQIAPVATLFCDTLLARPLLTRLLAMVHSTLEQNVSLEAIRQFKQFLAEHLQTTGALLEQALQLAPGAGVHVLFQAQALVIGFQHLANPAPLAQTILEEPPFDWMHVTFATEFRQAFVALLRGREEQ